MKPIIGKIWQLALPYQDKRDDAGHAEISLKYAGELVEIENGNEDVILPAIILHDIGWSQLDKKRRLLIFNKDASKEDKLSVQLEHQNEGVKLAADILREVNYPEELSKEVLEIISQHDTREGFISKNEGLVRDADKLWRTSKEGVASMMARNKPGDEIPYEKIEESINKPDYFYSETARQMAMADFKLRMEENHIRLS